MPTAARSATSRTSGAARRSSSSCPRTASRRIRNNAMTERLYYADPYLPRVRRATSARGPQRRPFPRCARSHRLLSHLRRPALRCRYRSPRVAPCSTSSTATMARWLHVSWTCATRARLQWSIAGAGRPCSGAIDWTRRFDHMQQHTGQHVLSAAIDRLFGVRTVSFHLGTDVVHDRPVARADARRARRG